MAENNHSNHIHTNSNDSLAPDSVTPRPTSHGGRQSPANIITGYLNPLSPIPRSRSPSLHAMVASPPHSPRLPVHSSHHSRSPSFSSSFNVVDLLASQAVNGTKPVARDWTKIPLSELVQGQNLVFVDGDKPVEEVCRVTLDIRNRLLTVDAR